MLNFRCGIFFVAIFSLQFLAIILQIVVMKDDKEPMKKSADSQGDAVVIDLSQMRKKREEMIQKGEENPKIVSGDKGFTPKNWNITYKNDRWSKGSGAKVGPKSLGNSGYSKGAPRGAEPFFNFGVIPAFSKYFAALLVVAYLVLNFALPAGVAAQVRDAMVFSPLSFKAEAVLSPLAYVFTGARGFELVLNAFMVVAFGTMIERRFGLKAMVYLSIGGALVGAGVFALIHAGAAVILTGSSVLVSALFGFVMMQMSADMKHAQLRGLRPQTALSPRVILGVWAAIIIGGGLLAGDPSWVSSLACFGFGVGLYEASRRGLIQL